MTLADYRRRRGEPLTSDEHAEDHGSHPGAREYLLIGAYLTLITAIEVGIYYIDMSHDLLVAALIVFSVTKFTTVVAWFMHLKFDNRLFTILFVTGLFGAMIIFTAALATLDGSFV